MGQSIVDVEYAIVGGGIAGASVAYHLAPHGSVALVEAEAHLAYHSTGRSVAVYAETYGNRTIRALTSASKSFFKQPPRGFSDHPLLQARGALYIARPDQQRSLDDFLNDVAESAPQVSRVHPNVATSMVPVLREGLSTCAWDPGAADIEVHGLHSGFVRGAKAHGAVILSNFKVERVTAEKGVWCLHSADRGLRARTLVNAAGAWADQVASLVGAKELGLVPMRRTVVQVVLADQIDIRRWPVVVDIDETFYFKPDAEKIILSPADETPAPPGDAYPDDLDIAVAVDRVEAAVDFHIHRIEHRWAGLRTFASDRAPVAGYDPTVPRLFWLAGQGGYGIQTAPALGELAANLVRGEPIPEPIAARGLTTEHLSPRRLLTGSN